MWLIRYSSEERISNKTTGVPESINVDNSFGVMVATEFRYNDFNFLSKAVCALANDKEANNITMQAAVLFSIIAHIQDSQKQVNIPSA